MGPILKRAYRRGLQENFMFVKSKSSVSALTNFSIDLFEQKKYKQAEKLCRKLLKKDAENYTALINLANVLFIKKEFAEALSLYQQADVLKPDYYPVKINLANTYLETENFEAAVQYANEALALDSQSYLGWNILGNALLEKEEYQAAVDALEKAEKLDSSDPWLYNSLSRAYQQTADYAKALKAGWQAVGLSAGEDSQQINFGYLLYETAMENNAAEVKDYARRWLKNYPENQIALHMGNAVINEEKIERANDGYLQNIFDVFAPDFEQVLSSLDYQTPQQIGGFLEQFYAADSHPKLKILDAGCGTGLCGKYLKKYAGFFSLSGVDLSSEMLKIAKAKKLYNRLYCQELNTFLGGRKKAYDLIVSADVLTYFGSLDSLFANLFSALKKSGRVIFSVTANEQNDEDYFLHISGRFQHHETYIKRLLQDNGFILEKQERTRLRKEGEQEVWGWIFAARRP